MPFKDAMVKFFAASSWGAVFLIFFAASLLAAVIFPEFLITHNLEFVLNTFYGDYWGAFTLTNFFYQGGIQLWDPYDQMPLAYYCLTLGIYKFFNVLVALVYILFSPLHTFQAEFFQNVYSSIFFLSNLFLKVVGSYLLFRKFTSSRAISVFSAIYSSVIISAIPFVSGGLSYGSYVPLLIYFTFNVFEYFRLRDILCWVLFFCICWADNAQHTAYLYQGIHFMILACIVWVVARKKCAHREQHKVNWKAIALTTVACLMLVTPVICMLNNLMGSMDFGDKTRISHLWNWHSYFTREMSFNPCSLPHFLSTLVSYYRLPFWVCVGYVVLFFALFGLVMSRDNRKYIILTAVIFMWMLNHPRDSFPFGALAHTINFLTNPLSFSMRIIEELHLYFLPVWLMSLAVIGMESFHRPVQKRPLFVFLFLLILYLALAFPRLSPEVRFYCIVQFFISLAYVYFYFFRQKRPRCLPFLLGALIIIDAAAMISYDRNNVLYPYNAHAHVIEGRPGLGLVGVNYQNPRILPYREHFDLSVYTDRGNPYLFSQRVQSVPGMFFRYTNFARNFYPGLEIRPKHKSYSFWDADDAMKYYLSKDTRLIVSGDAAIRRSEDSFDVIPTAEEKRALWTMSFDVGNDPTPFLKDGYAYVQFKIPNLIFKDSDGKVHEEDFVPKYVASTFLTDDQNQAQFYVKPKDGAVRQLMPVQGQIVRPWTFDYNNIREGFLTAAFLPQDYPAGGKFVIAAPSPPQEGVVKIWKWQFDNLGFDYVTHRGRWLVLHYPYDLKWRITVDGAKQPFYRVNKSFIGFPVQEGKHHILVQYWPGTPLRWLLLISTVVAFVVLLMLIHYALKDH